MPARDDILIEEAFAQRPMTFKLFRRLATYVRPYQRLFQLNLLFTVLATLSQLLGPKFVQLGIDRYLTAGIPIAAATQGLLLISLLFLANQLAGWWLSLTQVKQAISIGQGAMNDLRLAVFEHLQKLSLSYFDQTHQGRILNRADSDIDALDRVLTWGATQLVSSSVTLLGVVALLLQYDWRLCLAVSLVLPPLALATQWFHREGMAAYRRVRQHASQVTSAMAENVTGVRVVQAFTREEENLSRFQHLHHTYGEHVVSAARIFHTYMPLVFLLSGAGTTVILGYGGSLVMQGQITVGELAAFILYLGMFFGPIQTMGDLYNSAMSTAASAERIFQLLDTAPTVSDRPHATDLPAVRGHIRFHHVWFRYETTPPDTWILRDIDFEAQPGQTVALVGATGSGKTSIMSLLARFYEPQRGRITMDGIDIQSATLASLHHQIGIVTQDNFLFTGTVMENLKFGRPDAEDAEVIDAARALGVHDRILRLKEGYATPVHERGSNLSAGERQLLCFVRAMTARPRILILDEATSAVDSQTEAVIQHALEKLFERRTCFVIAHRLSTVKHAHQILVLSHGIIVERGCHDDLVRAQGPYARLYAEFVRQ